MRISFPCSLTLPRHCWKPLFSTNNSDTGCLRWRKGRTHLGFPECACETSEGDSQIHSAGFLINFSCIFFHRDVFARAGTRTRDLRNRYVAQKFLYGTTEPFRHPKHIKFQTTNQIRCYKTQVLSHNANFTQYIRIYIFHSKEFKTSISFFKKLAGV